jgi:hypothetical protein
MKISVTYALSNYVQEFDLIERLCKYEGHTFAVIYPEHVDFKKYYKGGHPAILVDVLVEDQPVVLYGFWEFAEFLLKNGMLRC